MKPVAGRPKRLPTVCLLLTACFLLVFFPGPGLWAVQTDQPALYEPELELSVSASAAIVISPDRSQRLYTKQADKELSIPAASQLMTALLACERVPLNTLVTISKEAATAALAEKTADGVVLRTGDKYPMKYLLLRLLFYHSKASAIAIAEQISNVEEAFVSLMNTKAEALELHQTIFLNATGHPVYDSPMDADDPLNRKNTDKKAYKPLQYSTVSDVAKLLAYAMNNQTFADLIKKESDVLLLDDSRLVSMHNVIQSLWTLSEGRVRGAYFCETSDQSYLVAIGTVNAFNVIMVTADGLPQQRIVDLLALLNGIERTYIQSSLVQAGTPFEGYQEETVDGEAFGLLYRRSVSYIHPINDDFIDPAIQYYSNGPHRRPIESDMTVGQVIFRLRDGTSIAVEVKPDRQILSKISLLNKILSVLQGNRNLFILIAFSGSCLFVVLLVQLILSIRRLIRLLLLVVFERRSRQ